MQKETTVREDLMSAIAEVKAAETPPKEVPEKTGTPDIKTDVSDPKETRDEKGKFKAKVEVAPKEVVAPPAPIEDAPISLSAAAKSKWAELPQEVRQEFIKREKDVEKMFTSHDGELRLGREMKDVITPYMATIQSEGGTPATAVRDLLNTAYVLRTGSPQQKAAIVQQVIQQYGIDMNVVQQQGNQDPTIQALQNEIYQMKQQYNPEAMQKQLQDRLENDRIMSEVQAFSSDPANKHYEQVKPLMASLLGSGQAQNMKEAYELACRAHPAVGSILEAERTAAAKTKQAEEIVAKKKAAASITGSPGATIPNSGSPDRTLREELITNYRAHTS